VGGCDIVTEMYESGELQEALGMESAPQESAPVASAAQAAPLSIENRL
jgi:monothiol glutaredoxin